MFSTKNLVKQLIAVVLQQQILQLQQLRVIDV